MYGAMAMAGLGAYNKVDGFKVLPCRVCMAATTFTGQNIGARRMDRVKKGLFQGMVICSIYTIGCVLLF